MYLSGKDKIIRYEFIQTKEPEYLGFLLEQLEKSITSSSPTSYILEIFSQKVKQIRENGRKGLC